MSMSTSGAMPALSNTTATPQNVTHNYENMVAQSGSQQINGPVYGNVHYGVTKSQDELVRDRILDSLQFDGMDRYHERPLESFPGTYEWILAEEPVPVHACSHCRRDRWNPACREMIESDERARQSAIDFGNWLRHSDQIFWVSGKAGAGKSCLMKFLADHPRTNELLCEWAGTDVTICRFFFWAAGGELERSRKGLLRGLLHQLLSHDHKIIEHVLPQRWIATSRSMQHSPPWGERELREALARAVERVRESVKLCLFIDGLDEFTGDHQDLIDDLDALNGSPAVKICVSSRPWNIFRHRYGAKTEALLLKLHELTYRDLTGYVNKRLGPIGTTLFCDRSSGTHGTNLQSLILEKAQGVFLWVKLAVNGIRRGVSEGDSLRELHVRLKTTPRDITEFIEKIFESIEPVYKKHCARVLLLLLADFRARFAHLPLIRLWCLTQDAEDGRSAWEIPKQEIGMSELTGFLDTSQILANKWCKDLVDVIRTSDAEDIDQAQWWDVDAGQSTPLLKMGLAEQYTTKVWAPDHIAFAHRTIFDFARAKAEDGSLWHLAGTDFCPTVSEILAIVRLNMLISLPAYFNIPRLLYLFEVVPMNGEIFHRGMECKHYAIPLGARALLETSVTMQQEYVTSGGDMHWLEESSLDRKWMYVDQYRHDPAACGIMLLAEILRRGPEDLFWTMLAQFPLWNTRLARHCWIAAACSPERGTWSHRGYEMMPLCRTVVKLLEADIDVNELIVYEDGTLQSTWQRVLVSIHTHLYLWTREYDPPGADEYFPTVLDLLGSFLKRGADPGCYLHLRARDGDYLEPSNDRLLAIESFEFGIIFLDKPGRPLDQPIIREGLEAIIQRLREALDARMEISRHLSVHTADSAPAPHNLGVTASGAVSELEQGSKDDDSLAMIPHKRRRLDISDILN